MNNISSPNSYNPPIIVSASAVIKGLKLCLFEPSVRRFAIVPWLVGVLVYFCTLFSAFYAHSKLLQAIVGDPTTWLEKIGYVFAWLGLGLLLLVFSSFLSVIIVLIVTGVIQSSLAEQVLRLQNAILPDELSSSTNVIGEISRSLSAEIIKLLWLLPIIFIVLVAGFIPLLSPFAVLIGAWLISYQFIDVVLDVLRVRVRSRLAFAKEHLGIMLPFGLGLSLLWAIPLLGIILPPAATAGAAWLLSRPEIVQKVRALAGLSSSTQAVK